MEPSQTPAPAGYTHRTSQSRHWPTRNHSSYIVCVLSYYHPFNLFGYVDPDRAHDPDRDRAHDHDPDHDPDRDRAHDPNPDRDPDHDPDRDRAHDPDPDRDPDHDPDRDRAHDPTPNKRLLLIIKCCFIFVLLITCCSIHKHQLKHPYQQLLCL